MMSFQPSHFHPLSKFRLAIATALVFAGCFVGTAIGQSESTDSATAADFFPASTVMFFNSDRPDELISRIESHSVTQSVMELEQVKKAMTSPEFAMVMLGKTMIENKIDEPLLDSIKTNMSKGFHWGVDGETQGMAFVFQSSDEAKLKRLAGTLLNVTSVTATQQGKKQPFKIEKYREAAVAEFDDFLIARYQTWFVVTDKPKLAKKLVDNMIDGTDQSLKGQTWFQDAAKKHASADAWMAVDLEKIRAAGLADDLFKGKTDNPGAELILGGLLDALQHAPIATAELNIDQDLNLEFSLPFDSKWATDARRFFFGESMDGAAPNPLMPKNMIANLVSYRDIADWWLSKEDLFEENVIAQLAQVDSQLSTIFSGMDFGEDVLGALQPGVQIVVTENTFEKEYVPDIKLPAFAMIGKLKEPKKIRRKLKIAYQSVIGFANINLGMQGQPQLDLETETIGDANISAARYFYDDETEEGLLLFNFSPTIAFQGDYLIVSSNRDLAIELASSAGNMDAAATNPTNTRMTIDAEMLAKILKANRESLISQNMLEEGHTRKQAEVAIDTLLTITDLFKDGELDFQIKPDQMQLKLQIRSQ